VKANVAAKLRTHGIDPVEYEAQREAGNKRCGHCATYKPIDDFPFDRTRYDQRHGWCKACISSARRVEAVSREDLRADVLERMQDERNDR
jgi:hypothetical protein